MTPALEGSAVLLSAHPWRGLPLGLHHVARVLAEEGRPVLFVEPPFSPLHLAAGRRRGRKLTLRPRPSGEANISLFSPFTLLPHQNKPLLRSRLCLDHWPDFCVPGFFSGLRGTCFEHPDLLISGSSLFSPLARTMKAGLRAFRLADDERLFEAVPEAMRERTMSDLPGFDIVFATSRPLEEMARKAGARRVVAMPNGFDPRRFGTACALPAELAAIPSPRIVYVGAMERWFDWQAVCAAALALPSASFVLVGKPGGLPDTLPPNIHLLGPRPHATVPALLQHCDVGIIPFGLKGGSAALKAINPIKLWEYLAAGLPVVASADLDLPQMPKAVRTYDETGGFVAQLESALAMSRGTVASADLNARSWRGIVGKALAEAAS